MKRRKFLKSTCIALSASAVNPFFLNSSFRSDSSGLKTRTLDYVLYDEYPWPYDMDYMGSSERVFFDRNDTAWLNVLVRPGKKLDIRLYVSATKEELFRNPPKTFIGVEDSFDLSISGIQSPRLYYKIEYREGKNPWKSHAPREVKTPQVDLEKGNKVKIILWGDNHLYSDLDYEPEDSIWRKDFLSGNYINRMLREIIKDPCYEPDFVNRMKTVEGYTCAWTLKYILESRPDFVIDLGDTVGPDSYNVWGENGQWAGELQPENALGKQSKILWERTRRSLASLSPEIPYYLVSGNHDGENGWESFTPYSRRQRERLFKLPELEAIHFPPVNTPSLETSLPALSSDRKFALFPEFNGNHYAIGWAKGNIQFTVLTPLRYVSENPRKVTDWTLGDTQKKTFGTHLELSYGIPWKFICFHHTLGGYPLGSRLIRGAYGRGPLFTRNDYEKASDMAKALGDPTVFDPDKVEQVWLTELAKKFNTRGFFYGHDHIFFMKNIGKTSLDKKMVGVCAGSTKYAGPNLPENIWCNPYWQEFYGSCFQNPPPYLTPPGITEVDIEKDKTTIKYVCSAPSECMGFNMLPGIMPGEVVRKYVLYR
jgi:hypothetical protein